MAGESEANIAASAQLSAQFEGLKAAASQVADKLENEGDKAEAKINEAKDNLAGKKDETEHVAKDKFEFAAEAAKKAAAEKAAADKAAAEKALAQGEKIVKDRKLAQ